MSPYWGGFAAGFRRTLASPAELAMRLGFFGIILVVLAGLWRSAVSARGGILMGYSGPALFWYVFAAQCAVMGVRPRATEEIGDEIGSGALVIAMLRPVSVVGMRMALEAGEATARLIGAFVIGNLLALVLAGPPPSAAGWALSVPAIELACLANIASQHVLGGIAFWLQDAKAGWFLYQKLVFLPGGMLMPLELLPVGIAAVCRVLPFAAMAYVPGRIASGDANPTLLVGQVVWISVLTAAAIATFAAGQRRLLAVGG